MNNKSKIQTLEDLENFIKSAFVPSSQKEAAVVPPMDPNMMQPVAGGVPPSMGIPPVDPSMAMQGVPMDPSAMIPAQQDMQAQQDNDAILKIIDEFANANKYLEEEVKRLSAQLEMQSQQLLDVQKSYASIEGKLDILFNVLNGKPIDSGFGGKGQ